MTFILTKEFAAWSSSKEHCDSDQHGLSSKPVAILLCPWKRQFMALSPACQSW